MTNLADVHTEHTFENEVCEHLAAHGWSVRTHLRDATSYDRALALYPDDLLAYVRQTQPGDWAKFERKHGAQSETLFVSRVAEQLDRHGTLHVLRHGFKDVDASFFLCQFQPASGKNPKLWDWFEANRLTAIRQLHYSVASEKSFDLVLFVNGIPVATTELKTALTQPVTAAIAQYKRDRLPRDPRTRELEPLLQFKTRALVHFAVSSDQVFMTTRLAGDKTYFLPFNLGKPDGQGGATAGNPPAPPEHGYPTWYLWKVVWSREVWLDILGNFLHLEVKEVEDRKTRKKTRRETLIFPRYHQLDAVRKLVAAAATEGAGRDYLVQHSAGSGKSNSIAWTAHRLTSLHDASDTKVFNSVIVITDRRVLDRQLQDTIIQFEHKQGVVQPINENSAQLAKALADGTPIIVTTLQKFPFVLQKVDGLKDKRFALIVDEAHSSQTGLAAKKLRELLGSSRDKQQVLEVELEGTTVEVTADVEIDPEDVSSEDVINQVLASQGRPENISYFAFTATPKAKTLERFGRMGPGGVPEAFHVYSMRQAIDEGFILDVLENYTPYQTFYRLGSQADERLVPARKAKKALARYAALHPYNITQKVVVIVEHFREHVAGKIGGRAKAMVVADGRVAAVRYKLAVDKYLKERGYDKEMRALVAFSGTVTDAESGPEEFTESAMNPGLKGSDPAKAFEDDSYRLLLVANKYQTGFDQPLLHTMYVDKRLSGVLAVQTLSRLNRTCAGKEDTFVLDFVNDPQEILKSFQPYYRAAQLESVTSPNIVHELQTKLDRAGVYFVSEVEAFAKVFYDPKRKQASLHTHLKPALERFRALEESDEAEQFRKDLTSFLRLYDFLSQIIAYQDPDLEKLYAFGKHLAPQIAEKGGETGPLALDSDVRLTHYRLNELETRTLDLASGEIVLLKPPSEVGSGKPQDDEEAQLALIVGKMNDLFSGDLTEADMVGALTTWQGKLMENETLAAQAENNSESQFGMGDFHELFTNVVIEGQERHNRMADQLLKDERIFSAMEGMMAKLVYRAFQRARTSPHTMR